MPEVAWITIAPVKGLGLVSQEAVQLGPTGVAENRRFYVLDGEGRMVNGKRFGPLVQVKPDYDGGSRLELRFPDGRSVGGAIALGEPVTAGFFGRPVAGRLVVGPWSEALSEWAGRPLRLVRIDEIGAGVDRGALAPVSLVSRASLEALQAAARADGPVDGRRFRMLFGIDGVSAHEEDAWLGRQVRIGEALIVPLGHVGRCATTTQDPDTGVRSLDTLGAIESYRGDVESAEPLPFGVYAEVVRPGRVAVGDSVDPSL